MDGNACPAWRRTDPRDTPGQPPRFATGQCDDRVHAQRSRRWMRRLARNRVTVTPGGRRCCAQHSWGGVVAHYAAEAALCIQTGANDWATCTAVSKNPCSRPGATASMDAPLRVAPGQDGGAPEMTPEGAPAVAPARDMPGAITGSRLAQDVNGNGGFFDAQEAAAVFLHRVARARHLPGACLAAQLGRELVELAQPGRAQRVALGLQAAGRVHGQAPAQGEVATLLGRPAFAQWRKAEVLDLDDLAHGGGVMHL